MTRLDRRAFKAVAGGRDGPVGRLLPGLSNAANNSVLWIGVAALMATFGGRRGKRAAGRGLGSIAVTSLVVTQGLKRVVERPRPPLDKVPAIRRLKAVPSTTSFPSGHAASAAAFTTATLMEWRRAGLALLPLAAAVACSRVYVGVHYPGDVLAGAAIGAGIASASRLQFPVVPDRAAAGPAGEARDPGPLDRRGNGLRLLVNPGSGSPVDPDPRGPVEIALPGAGFVESRPDEPLAEALARTAESASAIGAAGGDGTIGAAAVAAAAAGLPLLVLPTGTLNHLARDLRIDGIDDSLRAYRSGQAVAIDLGTLDEETFVNTATFGAYPEMIELRERLARRIGRWPAHALAVLWTALRAEPLEAEINGERRVLWMAFVGNCAHEPAGFAPAWRPRLDDGLLDLRILHGERPWAKLRLLASILTGRLASSAAYERHLLERIEVDAGGGRLAVTRDGDHCELPARFTIGKRPACLTVFAPVR